MVAGGRRRYFIGNMVNDENKKKITEAKKIN